MTDPKALIAEARELIDDRIKRGYGAIATDLLRRLAAALDGEETTDGQ